VKPLLALLVKLLYATVFLTSRRPLPLGSQLRVIELDDLEQPEAQALIRVLLGVYYVEKMPLITDDEIMALWKGGNPRKIEQAVFSQRIPQPAPPRKCVSSARQFDRSSSTKESTTPR